MRLKDYYQDKLFEGATLEDCGSTTAHRVGRCGIFMNSCPTTLISWLRYHRWSSMSVAMDDK